VTPGNRILNCGGSAAIPAIYEPLFHFRGAAGNRPQLASASAPVLRIMDEFAKRARHSEPPTSRCNRTQTLIQLRGVWIGSSVCRKNPRSMQCFAYCYLLAQLRSPRLTRRRASQQPPPPPMSPIEGKQRLIRHRRPYLACNQFRPRRANSLRSTLKPEMVSLPVTSSTGC
jgi:hypothetical protein